ncbi:hypothetical protein JCM15764A_11980 [Geotalea toluenoxydans]
MISHMARQVSESSSAIREACIEQTSGSLRIKRMVHSISTSTRAVLEETKVVNRGVSNMGSNTELLQKEMAGFNL